MVRNPYSLRARVARKLTRALFPFFERHLDLNVVPADYYSPIPRVDELPQDIYERRFSPTGVEMNEAGQLASLRETLARYLKEFAPKDNPGLSRADAFALYAMIRDRRPKRIVEIGGGHSTLIALEAIKRNRAAGDPVEFVCVEPLPSEILKAAAAREDLRLLIRPVQQVDLGLFDETDILFIDSSHVCRIGGDVTHEMLEIVPRLPIGAVVHWHDIVLPANYWREWTEYSLYFWNEGSVLHAFLLFNRAFKVRWAARYMALNHEKALTDVLPFYRKGAHITSFWAERHAP